MISSKFVTLNVYIDILVLFLTKLWESFGVPLGPRNDSLKEIPRQDHAVAARIVSEILWEVSE